MHELRLGSVYRGLVLERLGLDLSGEDLLEVGCHDASISHGIEATRKVGIDLVPYQRYADIDYVKGDFLSHDFGERSFDLVLALEVMEHVSDPALFVEALDRVLSRDGRALISVPSCDVTMFPAFLQAYLDKKWGHHHRRGYSREELSDTFIAAMPRRRVRLAEWDCPFLRTSYLALKIVWALSPSLAQRLLARTVSADLSRSAGSRGYYFVLVGDLESSELPLAELSLPASRGAHRPGEQVTRATGATARSPKA